MRQISSSRPSWYRVLSSALAVGSVLLLAACGSADPEDGSDDATREPTRGGTSVVTYPEYNLLVADSQVSVAIVFNSAEHGDVSTSDAWYQEYLKVVAYLKSNRFQQVAPGDYGVRYARTVQTSASATLTETVDLLTPEFLGGGSSDGNVPAWICDFVTGKHEIIMYLGHSFSQMVDSWEYNWGGLNLFRAGQYPSGTYQIVFVNSCWSSKWYAPDVASRNPLADFVGSSEMTNYPTHAIRAITLMKSLFTGAEGESGGKGEVVVPYHWQGIIAALSRNPGYYGYAVAGDGDNTYVPKKTPPAPPPNSDEFKSSIAAPLPIPGGNSTGITDTITVDKTFVPKAISVSLDLDSQRGMPALLVVYLQRKVPGPNQVVEVEIARNKFSYGAANPIKVNDSRLLAMAANGDWTLRVVNSLKGNELSLKGWSLVLTEK